MYLNAKNIKAGVSHKNFMKKERKVAFAIVKKHIDELDLMGLLGMGCPNDEYEGEVAEITSFAIKTKNENDLTDIIIKVFDKAFEQDFNVNRKQISKASAKIFWEFKALSHTKKETYFIPKDLLPGSCYFEFQKGRHKIDENLLDSSIYLYGDDDGNFDYSVILPFTYLITGRHPNKNAGEIFDYHGITYIDESYGQKLVKNLRKFAVLLGNGESIYGALESMNIYKPSANDSCKEKDRTAKLDLDILKNTAEELADWTEETLAEYKIISVRGI
jgi:hypothetical protein